MTIGELALLNRGPRIGDAPADAEVGIVAAPSARKRRDLAALVD